MYSVRERRDRKMKAVPDCGDTKHGNSRSAKHEQSDSLQARIGLVVENPGLPEGQYIVN